ncbi:hypothetical protein D1007_01974 [Hordeum vulgare]|nr:hypothetical protein D1007_01974 [Hordeum vulgare]
MEKKELLGVRTKQAAGKRRRKVAAGRGLAKAVADYLVSDSYMYAPLVSEPQEPPPPPPAAAPATSTPPDKCHCALIYLGNPRVRTC